MKLLITGATGLIGRAIVELSNKQGIPVNYLTTDRTKIVSNDNFNGYYWNPDQNEIDLSCFEGVTAIINLAGSSIAKKWTADNKNEILSSRINAIKTLNYALGKTDSKKITSFVSASAIGIYPSSLSHFYTEEELRIDDSFLGEVVHEWEKEIDTLEHFGIPFSKVRIGMVLSKDGGVLPELAKPIKSFVGSTFGNGKQWQSWIHIVDLARLFLFIVENQLCGTYNGVSPNPITHKKMVHEVAKVFNKPLLLPNIPWLFMKLVLGEMSYLLFASQRVSSKKIAEEGFAFEYPNFANALQQFYNGGYENNSVNDFETEDFLS
ncbi:TIGR01777 family oxidoreductase [Maribacter sp. HTCC2170]|uniref:TIGR01777 family oxidoreductase n=1 Tax=Maribacter sp. (strain HTCC2170 / KCCM 42371) TaxID=313603 RepID=UPI00006B217C|nr:TIGR01777 family oxidoreductase [Maribacter sp. HTCC2170]EAR00229.1 Cell division inhibitor [Maribacter sp. HTCC2170]